MKASELRIGNLVKPLNPRHSEQWVTIESISIDSINVDFRAYGLSEIEPIPLTEEWLLKFGLTKDKDVEYPEYAFWVKGAFNIYYNEDRTGFCFEVYSHYIPVQHVHQLQNLFYALTGEELTIKE